MHKWLQSCWRGRGTIGPDRWRLNLVVILDSEPVGQQDLTGDEFDAFGTVETTSWVSTGARRSGIGYEVRSVILHLVFEGLGAAEASNEAAMENIGSNRVSEQLGFGHNGTAWATHQGKPVLGQRWRLEREAWAIRRSDDITMAGVEECRATLGIKH